MGLNQKYSSKVGIVKNIWRSIVLSAALIVPLSAHALPNNFVKSTALAGNGLSELVNVVTFPAPDTRMFVLERTGRVSMFDYSIQPGVPTFLMTLPNILTSDERGLASIALDPDFENNGFIYLYYTHAEDVDTGRNRISRFTFNNTTNTLSLASEVMVWEESSDVTACCHFGGGMDFGPVEGADQTRKLYLATGDAFDSLGAQDLTSSSGKIIRLNTGNLDSVGPWTRGGVNAHIIPSDNPVSIMDGPGGNLDEIWASGLRNPYRAHWDLVEERFYIGEVGGNVQSTATEDIHIGRAGANYGWPFCEGDCTDETYDDPIHVEPHNGSNAALTAGVIYRGGVFPALYDNVFFYSDYTRGYMKYLTFDEDGQKTADTVFGLFQGPVVAIEEGHDGALYNVVYTDNAGNPRIDRIEYDAGNRRPIIESATATPVDGNAPLTVTFSATATDFEGDALTYEWFFSDGTAPLVGSDVTRTFTTNGLYTAYVSVFDSGSQQVSFSNMLEVQVGQPPAITITSPVDGALFRANDVISFDADVPPNVTLDWDIKFLHASHPHPTLVTSDANGTFTIVDFGHDYTDLTRFQIELTATDATGLSTTESVTIWPDKVDLTFSTAPLNFDVSIDGNPRETPFVLDTLKEFRHGISVEETFCIDNMGYEFDSWSSAKPKNHNLVVPDADDSLVATYIETGVCGDFPQSGLIAHYESDAGVVLSGPNVVAWNDISGNNNDLDLIQGNPLINYTVANGNPAFLLDNSLDSMGRYADLTGFSEGSDDRTLFFVARYRGNAGYGGLTYGRAGDNEAFGLVMDPNQKLAIQGYGAGNNFSSTVNRKAFKFIVQSVVLDGNNGVHFENGTQIDTFTHTFDTVAEKLVMNVEIDGDPAIDMFIAAAMIYDRALNPQERGQVEAYLQSKYLGNNAPPVANDDSLTIESGATVDIAVLVNDEDDNGIIANSIVVVSAPTQGTAVANADGTVTYTPNAGAVSPDSFSYTIKDAAGETSNTATVTISIIAPFDDPPMASNDSSFVSIGDSVTINVLVNDADDVALAPGTVQIASNGAEGVATANADGTVTYVNASSVAGEDSFTYTVRDNANQVSNVATVIVGITDDNGGANVPSFGLVARFETDAGLTVDPGTGVVNGWLDQSERLNHMLQIQGDPTVVASVVNGKDAVDFDGFGDALVNGDIAGFPEGSEDRTIYTVVNYRGFGWGGVAWGAAAPNEAFGVVVGPNNGAPGGALGVQGWGGANFDTRSAELGANAGWLVQSAIVDDEQLTHQLNGTQINSRPMTYATTSDLFAMGREIGNFKQIDMQVAAVFVYDRALSAGEQNQLQSYLQDKYFGISVDLPPVASADTATVVANGTALVDVLINDSDDSQLNVATVAIVDQPTEGTATPNTDGTITYVHGGGAATQDTFTYTVDDDAGLSSNVASVTVTITGGNGGGPFPQGGLVAHFESDTGLSTGAGGVVTAWGDQSSQGNDLQAAGDPIVVANVLNGQPIVDFDGTGDLMANAAALSGFPINDQDRTVYMVANYQGLGGGGFGYGSSDLNEAFGLSVANDGILRINAYGPTDAKSTTAGTGAGWLVQSAVVSADQLSHFVDGQQIDSATNTYNTTSQDLTLGADLDGTPAVDMQVAALLVYDRALSAAEQAEVQTYLQDKYFGTVVINTPPVAVNDAFTVESGALTVIDILQNDSDSDGLDPSTLVVLSGLTQGALSSNSDGTFNYGSLGGSGATQDTFTYTVEDTLGAVSNEATVNITINSGEPPAIPQNGLVAHLETDTGLIVNGAGQVTSWLDQSGENNNLSAVGDPTEVTGALNGQSVIDLDGAGDLLSNAGTLNSFPSDDGDRTVYTVINYREAGWGGIGWGTPATNEVFGLVVSNNNAPADQQGTLGIQAWGGAAFDRRSTTAAVGTGFLVQSAVLSNDILVHQLNGNQIDVFANSYDTATDEFFVGGEVTGSTKSMQVAAVMVYDRALSSAEQTQVQSYLQDKYFGTAVNLAPVASADTATVVVNGTALVDVLINDSDDSQLNVATVAIVDQPTGGTATPNTDGTISYVHGGGAGTQDTFTYTVDDDAGLSSNVASVTVTITGGSGGGVIPQGGLIAHFESDTGLNTGAGGVVTTWGDQSSQGNDLQAAGNPTVVANVLNGQSIVDFDGTGDLMTNAAALSGFPVNDQDRTVYMVANYQGIGGGGFSYGSSDLNEAFGLSVANDGKLRINAYGPTDAKSTTAGTGAGWLVQSAVVSADQLSHFVDGQQIDSATNTYDTTSQDLTLGADLDGTPAVDMQVAALLVYDRALSAAEQADVQGYLQNKYFGTTPVNQAPVAAADTTTVVASGTALVDVLINDTDDVQLNVATVAIVGQPTQGTATPNADGTISYVHGGGSATQDTFTYTVDDDAGLSSNVASVTVTITGGSGGGFIPQAGLVAHFESDTGLSTGAGGVVSAWGDQSSQGNDLQAAGNPTVIAGALNGQPIVDFDGTGDLMTNAAALSGFPVNDQDRTVYMVANYQGLGGGGFGYGSSALNQAFGLSIANNGDLRVNAFGPTDEKSTTAGTGAGWLVQSAVVNADQLSHFVDGQLIDSATNTYATTSQDLVLGADLDLAPALDMQVAALMVYDRALSAAEQAEVQSYLQDKYFGGAANLPQGGLVARFESDTGVDLATNGVVNRWNDQSGQDNDLIATGDIALVANELNGQPVLDFDGNLDLLSNVSALSSFPVGDQDRTVYMVANYQGLGGGGFGYGSSDLNQAFGLSIANNGNLRVNAYGPTDEISTTPGTGAGWLVQSAIVSADQLVHFVDGQQIDSATNSYNTTADGLVLGADLDKVPALDMQVAALLVYDRALSAAEQADVQGYLQNKYFGTTPVNQAPVAAADTATVASNATVAINVLVNDTDDAGVVASTVTIAAGATQGTAVANANGTISYTHGGGVAAQDSFSYTVSDAAGLVSNVATVSVSITGTGTSNNAPVAAADDADVDSLDSVTISVLTNDTDDGTIDPGSVSIVMQPLDGTATVNANGTILYTHSNGGGSTFDSFSYTVKDTLGLVSNEATVIVNINGGGQNGPVAAADSGSVFAGGTVSVNVVANDGAVDPATVEIAANPTAGTVSVNANGSVSYTNTDATSSTDTFAYTVRDSQGAQSNAATVTMTILNSGTPTVPQPGLVAYFEADTGVGVAGADQVVSWSDQSGQSNDLSAVGGPTLIENALNGQSVIDFDGAGDALLNIAALNNFPLNDDDRTVYLVANYRGFGGGGFGYGNNALNEAFGLSISAPGDLRVNAFGPAADKISDTVGTGAGWLVQSVRVASDQMVHSVDGVQIDSATRTYATTDGDLVLGADLDQSPAIDMQVAALLVYDRALTSSEEQSLQAYLQDKYFDTTLNQAPVAANDTDEVTAGGTVLINVLANDTDDVALASNSVQIVPNSGSPNGTVTANTDGTITYTHDNGTSTQATFSYTVEDEDGLVSNQATVTVDITDVVGAASPPQLGLVAHYEADEGVDTNAAGEVTGWADQSGQANDLLPVGNPTLIANALNGEAVIDFDGNGDALVRSASLNSFPFADQDRTVYLVASYEGPGSGGFGYGSSAVNQSFGLSINTSGLLRVDAFGPNNLVSDVAGTGAGWLVQSATVAANQLEHSVDGVSIDNAARTYATSGDLLVIGADLDQAPAVDMKVAAVLVYSRALTAAEEVELQTYLQEKYF